MMNRKQSFLPQSVIVPFNAILYNYLTKIKCTSVRYVWYRKANIKLISRI